MTNQDGYVSRTTMPLRYRDLDTLGHLNQSIYHVFLEESRAALMIELTGPDPAVVLAHVELDHRHEVVFADREVLIETTIEHVGRSSVRLSSRMLVPSGTLVAEATTVMVGWDSERRTGRPLTEAERAGLSRAWAGAAADPAG